MKEWMGRPGSCRLPVTELEFPLFSKCLPYPPLSPAPCSEPGPQRPTRQASPAHLEAGRSLWTPSSVLFPAGCSSVRGQHGPAGHFAPLVRVSDVGSRAWQPQVLGAHTLQPPVAGSGSRSLIYLLLSGGRGKKEDIRGWPGPSSEPQAPGVRRGRC